MNSFALILPFVFFTVAEVLLQEAHYIKPRPRWGNGCTLIKKNVELLCYGGQQKSNALSNSMYSLNLSKSWSTTDPAWSLYISHDPNNVTSFISFFAEAYTPNRNYFFIDGGSEPTQKKAQTLYFDIENRIWNYSSSLDSKHPARRKQHTAVSDDKGQLWLWGGVSDSSTYNGPTLYYNTWTIIDTNIWSVNSLEVERSPPPRIDHTATIISNRYILITGGVIYSPDITDPTEKLTLNPVSMSSLLLFDIQHSRWYNVTAGGNIPAPRRGHSAVLSIDGTKIIIFGGGTADGQSMQFNDVFILELSTMQWSAPSIEGVPPKPRKYHKSHLVGDYLLILFGLGDEKNGFNDVSILSITSWTWIGQYIPNMAWFSDNYTYSSGYPNNSINPLYDQNFHSDDEEKENRKESETRVKAGVMAGVVSGGVVILGGGLFLIISLIILKSKQKTYSDGSDISEIIEHNDSMQDSESTKTSRCITFHQQYQKPDTRSSIGYAVQPTDGEFYKPDVSL